MADNLEWIDSHTHLDMVAARRPGAQWEYPFPLDEYLSRARDAGVRAFVTIGTETADFERLRELAEAHADIYFTVGIHPHEAKDFGPAAEQAMDALRAHPKCVGVGEIGLDYYYDHSPRDIQRPAFERQLELALSWKKPVVIHARDAEDDLLERLRGYNGQCVIHCFSGTPHFAAECLKLGFYISFSGIVTFKSAQALRDIVATVPLDRILLETDSPFLAPMPYRGRPNQSAYLVETAKIVAQAKGVELAALSSATVANTRRFFGLS